MDPITLGLMMGVGKGVTDTWMGALGSLGKKNPYEAAMPYLEQLQPYAEKQYEPWQQAGLQAMQRLMPEYARLLGNPQDVVRGFGGDIYGENFQTSPGYQFAVDQAMQGTNAAMAASGLTGSTAHMAGAQQTAQNLANQEYYNYLRNQMGIAGMGQNAYGMGLRGLQGTQQMGYGATNQMSNAVMNAIMAQALNAQNQVDWQNQNKGKFLGIF